MPILHSVGIPNKVALITNNLRRKSSLTRKIGGQDPNPPKLRRLRKGVKNVTDEVQEKAQSAREVGACLSCQIDHELVRAHVSQPARATLT